MKFSLRHLWVWLLPAVWVWASCGSPHLERPQVPISWGMRIESTDDEAQINPNMAEMRRLVMRQTVLELSVVADTNGLPRIQPVPLGSFMALARQYRVRFHLALCTIRREKLFPDGRIADPEAWFAALHSQIDSLMAVLRGYPPERVVVGNDWLAMEEHPEAYGKMMAALRDQYHYFFSYGAQLARLEEVPLWEAGAEIAIDYTPTAEGDLKAISRKLNQEAGQFAIRRKMPVFIFRANIIGPEPTLQVMNRLRFWPDSTEISGLCINTLYATIAARDSSTYHGLAGERELFEFLDDYRRRGFEN